MMYERDVRIAVFIDGGFLAHVTHYYKTQHSPHTSLSIAGLLHFIREKVAKLEGTNLELCQITESHYFRGHPLDKSQQKALFDELTNCGVQLHLLPLKVCTQHIGGQCISRRQEQGVDVELALEAYKAVSERDADIVALITGDGDFVPLVKDLHNRGAKVLLLGWDFGHDPTSKLNPCTRTSEHLRRHVHYPLHMEQIIGDGKLSSRETQLLFGLHEPQKVKEHIVSLVPEALAGINGSGRRKGTIQCLNLERGIGRLADPFAPKGWFFHKSAVRNLHFASLAIGDEVEFTLGRNPIPEAEERIIAIDVRLLARSTERCHLPLAS